MRLLRALGAVVAAALATVAISVTADLHFDAVERSRVLDEQAEAARARLLDRPRLTVEDVQARLEAGTLTIEHQHDCADVVDALIEADDKGGAKAPDVRAWADDPASHKRMCRGSPAYFMRYELGMQVGPHHLEWSKFVGARVELGTPEFERLALLAARGHGKSAFWSYVIPIWRSWRDPNTQGLLISKTGDQAADLMRVVKDGKAFVDADGIEWKMPPAATVAILQSVIPPTWEKSWTTERIWFTNGSNWRAKTFGKSFRGAHVAWIVVDDPLGDDAQYSARAREKAESFLFRTISPMLLPAAGSQLAIIGTPLHGNDLHAALERNSEYFHRKYPGRWLDRTTGEYRYLWPQLRGERWHLRERLQNALAYQQEIELRPVSDVNSLFPPELFDRHPTTKDSTFALGQYTGDDCRTFGWRVFIGVDFAISSEVGADYTVIYVVAVDGHGFRRLIDMRRLHGAPYHVQLGTLRDLHARYQAELIVPESNGFQAIFGAELERTTDLPIKRKVTGTEKHHLQWGVPGLRPLLENGKWRFPRGDVASVEATDIILSELGDIRIVDGAVASTGEHDDCVMALWLVERAIRYGQTWGYAMMGTELDDDAIAARAEEIRQQQATEEARRARAEAEAARVAALAGAANPEAVAKVAAGLVEENADLAREARAEVVDPPPPDPGAALGLPGPPDGPTLNYHALTWRAALKATTADAVREACRYIANEAAGLVVSWNALQRVDLKDKAAVAAVVPVEVAGALRHVDGAGLRAMLADVLGMEA